MNAEQFAAAVDLARGLSGKTVSEENEWTTAAYELAAAILHAAEQLHENWIDINVALPRYSGRYQTKTAGKEYNTYWDTVEGIWATEFAEPEYWQPRPIGQGPERGEK